MLAVTGVYKDGQIILDEKINISHPLKVVVTFLEESRLSNRDGLDISQFSFQQSRQALKGLQSALSDTLIEERRASL